MSKVWKKCVAAALAGIMVVSSDVVPYTASAEELEGSIVEDTQSDESGAANAGGKGAGGSKSPGTSGGTGSAASNGSSSDGGKVSGESGSGSASTANGTDGSTGTDGGTGSAGADSGNGTSANGTGSGNGASANGTDSGNGASANGAGSGNDASANGASANGTDSGNGVSANGTGSGNGAASDGADFDNGASADGTDSGNGAAADGSGSSSADSDGQTAGTDLTDQSVGMEITTDTSADDNVVIAADDKPYLALGANLSEDQKRTVLSLMGIDAANLGNYNVVSVTNEEEHQYLDEYLDASTIGTRALSSVVIVKRDKGDGIHISTKNINYCTVGMYKNALATAGLEDADVIVAGPFPLSGTAALIGAMKAYADLENTQVDSESLDAAMNEIVVTGDLSSSVGDNEQSEEFIAYVKQKILEAGLQDPEKIKETISEAAEQFEISLTDSQKEEITKLMAKIGSLDIDVDNLIKQAGSIYDSIAKMEEGGGILAKIAAFFRRIVDAILSVFRG